jgi:hypothetical protein
MKLCQFFGEGVNGYSAEVDVRKCPRMSHRGTIFIEYCYLSVKSFIVKDLIDVPSYRRDIEKTLLS